MRLLGKRYKRYNAVEPPRVYDIDLYSSWLRVEWGYCETDDETEDLALATRGFQRVDGPPNDWQGWKKYEKPVVQKVAQPAT